MKVEELKCWDIIKVRHGNIKAMIEPMMEQYQGNDRAYDGAISRHDGAYFDAWCRILGC